MYICVCKAVTEKQIFQAVQAGAKHINDLKKELGVASECGRCSTCAKNCLSDAKKALAVNSGKANKHKSIQINALSI